MEKIAETYSAAVERIKQISLCYRTAEATERIEEALINAFLIIDDMHQMQLSELAKVSQQLRSKELYDMLQQAMKKGFRVRRNHCIFASLVQYGFFASALIDFKTPKITDGLIKKELLRLQISQQEPGRKRQVLKVNLIQQKLTNFVHASRGMVL